MSPFSRKKVYGGEFNLQDIEGIDEVAANIQRGELKAAFEELESASQLKKDGISFRFLTASRRHGEGTPDLEILLRDQQSVLYEIKGKEESSSLSISKIRSSMEASRKQFPKEKAGMILLKIPEAWPREAGINDAIQKVLTFPIYSFGMCSCGFLVHPP